MAGGDEAFAQAGGQVCKVLPPLRLGRYHVQGCKPGPDAGGGKGGVEDEGPRSVEEIVDDDGVRRDEPARGPERLRERPDHDHPFAVEPEVAERPATVRPEHAGGVRLVDDEDRIVASGAGDEARQGREIAVHAEDGLAHDQPAAAGGGRQELVEMVEVEMAVDLGGRTRKPAAIDDRRVVEGITEDEILGPGEGGEDTEVGEIAGTVEERALLALERGEALLQLLVEGRRAAEQARGAHARAVGAGGHDRALDHARIVSEPEVVVRGQVQERAPIDRDALALARLGREHGPAEGAGIERGELRSELAQPGASRGGLGRGHRRRPP